MEEQATDVTDRAIAELVEQALVGGPGNRFLTKKTKKRHLCYKERQQKFKEGKDGTLLEIV